MTTFFWVAQIANGITTVVALAALLIVVWLGPRRWTNISFACLMVAMIIWMGFSLIVRLLVNVPQLGGSPSALMNWVALGFALIGIMLFWFVESFYPIDRRVRLAANLAGVAIYAAFLALLWNNAIVTDVRRGSDGGIDFGITTCGDGPLGVPLPLRGPGAVPAGAKRRLAQASFAAGGHGDHHRHKRGGGPDTGGLAPDLYDRLWHAVPGPRGGSPAAL